MNKPRRRYGTSRASAGAAADHARDQPAAAPVAASYPAPPPAVIIAGLLRLIAAGVEPICCPPWGPRANVIAVAWRAGWWLALVADDAGEVVRCEHACPPSLAVPCWWRGCERDDWTLGPESKVVDPIELLTAQQRVALRERLKRAPVPRPEPEWWEPPEDVEEEWVSRPS